MFGMGLGFGIGIDGLEVFDLHLHFLGEPDWKDCEFKLFEFGLQLHFFEDAGLDDEAGLGVGAGMGDGAGIEIGVGMGAGAGIEIGAGIGFGAGIGVGAGKGVDLHLHLFPFDEAGFCLHIQLP